jgi:MEMO1 family protein
MLTDIRPSPIAGTWYPGTDLRLRDALDIYIGDAPSQSYEQLYGLWVPHAGMRYSGGIAGRAFRHLCRRQYDLVVVIAPSHYPYPYALLTSGHQAFHTPLGDVPVAAEIVEKLRQQIDIEPIRNDPEHAIEIELPFLQHILGEFRLIPIAMLDQTYEMTQRLAHALAHVLAGAKVLYVASSDLSHFYPQSAAQQLDQVILDAVTAYDAAEVIAADHEARGFACGRGAISTVMLAAHQQGAAASTIEGYATSGEVSGDYARVVGYGSATFHA